MFNSYTHRFGFTLVELLVAISITSVMLLFINRLFNDATTAATRGVQTAELVANHRSLAQQLRADFKAMRPPANPSGVSPTQSTATDPNAGILVIMHKDINRAPDGVPMPAAGGGDTFTGEQLQSDQILFMRAPSSLEPIAPGQKLAYAASGEAAGYTDLNVRVWYGHVERAEFDGTNWLDTSNLNAVNPTVDNFGHQWMLGRHAMFLVDISYTGALISAIHANGPFATSTVGGYTNPADPVSPLQTYMSLSDIADTRLSTAASDIGAVTAAIIDTEQAGPNAGIVKTIMPQVNYRTAVYPMLFGSVRMNVQPVPQGPNFEAYQVAMTHPIFLSGCSEFVIEFAADLDNNGTIETDPVTGAIEWFGGNNIPAAWTGYTYDPQDTTPGLANADVAWVWRHDYPDNWPYLIRIRYRLHDDRGRVQSNQYNAATNTDEAISGRWFEIILPVQRTP